MDRGAWWATVHGVTKSQTSLKRLRTHVSGEGNTKGALQITGGKIFSFNHLYSFSSSICPMLSSGAGLLTVEKENGRRVFSEGDSSSPDFQSWNNLARAFLRPFQNEGRGKHRRTREWTFHLNSEWSRAPFTDIFFLVSFWIQLWKLSSWDRVARMWYCGPLPDDRVKNFLAAWAQTFATPWISRWKERKKKRLYSQQLVSVGAEGSAGRFSFTSSMHSGFSKERSVREILSENKMPRLCS